MTMHKHHETRGHNDGLWQTYNGHSLDGDARDAYDVGYEQGCEEYRELQVARVKAQCAVNR